MDDYYEFNANSGSLILFRNRSEAEEKSAKALTGEVLLTDDILKELENFHGADLKVRGL